MKADSYLELALTLFAWDVSNKLATLLVGAGLIFIPIAWLYWKNWSEPARSQEAKAAAPVSLRRMEQDIGIALLVMLLAFLPAISVSSSDITYTQPTSGKEVNSNAVTVNAGQSALSVRVPVLWWIVIQFSSGFTSVFTAAINSFDSPKHFRALAMALDYTQISDPALKQELMQFDKHCYEPALHAREQNRLTRGQVATRDWRGADEWFAGPDYYNRLLPQPPLIPSGWENQYSHPDNPGPPCADWWNAPGNGLRDKLYDEIHLVVTAEPAAVSRDVLAWGGLDSASLVPANPSDQYKNDIVRSYLDRKTPPAHRAPGDDSSNKGVFSVLAAIGSFRAYPAIKTTMAALIVALPMIQAMILSCIYIALPLAVPFAVLKPGVIVFFAGAIFAVKFLTGIWALAHFIDERLISMMYGGQGVFAGSGTAADVLLWIVAILAYAGMPVIWLWLMSSFTSQAMRGANDMFTHATPTIAMMSQGMETAAKEVSGAAGKLLRK